MSQYPTIETNTATLERISLGVRVALSRQFLHGVELNDSYASTELDALADRIALQLNASVWSDPSISHNKTYELTYEKHPTWKHALVASLPMGSLRRRWCCFFWHIPLGYVATKVTQYVNVHVPAVLPEMQARFPNDFGRVMFPISITPR